MTVLMFPQKDVRPPITEPYDFKYQRGVSCVIMPNGSAMCMKQSVAEHATKQQAKAFEYLQWKMTMLWNEEWEKAEA